ncbi:hypothetical protein FHW96_001679 [Novosphingobium sp. SG751A]|uniref:hypothetical protein n=1 Tax=Novosphingobium sp. SG751A TaxID=2587000 RepID=UPI001555EEAB|nr:hypothetical protein [Novosphingobium sp. SG751A]NOW45524.1 hypothetical protein [Novosphingobium sp. SG751A]
MRRLILWQEGGLLISFVAKPKHTDWPLTGPIFARPRPYPRDLQVYFYDLHLLIWNAP